VPKNRETLLQLIKHAQSVNNHYRALFEQCEKDYQTMRPELQALSNRVAELLFDDELKTRVERFLNSEEQTRYKSVVDRIFEEVTPLGIYANERNQSGRA
jgi:Skp family chaperone for outer membrane proteins